MDRAVLKKEYTRRLVPVSPGEASPNPDATGAAANGLLQRLDRLLVALEGPARLTAVGRMERTLVGGQVFDAALELELMLAGGDGAGHVDLTVHHSPAAWSRFRGTLRDFRLIGLEPVEVHGPEAPVFPPGAADGRLAERVPLALGDVHLSDLDGLAGALRLGDLELLGELQAPGAEPLLVFELRFPDRPAGVSEYSTRGETALVHVDADDRMPRAVRVFDRAGRLVRTYSDLAFDVSEDTRWPSPRSFRVDAVASRSHTLVTIDRFEPASP